MNIIQKYLKYTKEHEAREIYHKWCIISAIASCLSGRCWTTLGYDKLNPNFFIVLAGPPAIPRKSAAIRTLLNLIQPLIDEGIINTTAESVTHREILNSLARSTLACPGIKNIDGSDYEYMSLHTIASELVNFIKVKDKDSEKLAGLLLQLFDGEVKYEHGTATQGTAKLKNVSLNLLAATTGKFFSGGVFNAHIDSGFASRCIFIWLDDRRANNPDPDINVTLKEEIQREFFKLINVTGHIPFSKEGKVCYDSWYKEQSLTIDTNVPKNMISYYGRRQTYVRKLSLVFWSLDYIQEGVNKEIGSVHVEEAIKTTLEMEKYMSRAYTKSGRSSDILDVNEVISYFQQHRGEWISRMELGNIFSIRDMKPETLDYIINSMYREMGVLEQCMVGTKMKYRFMGILE